MTDKESSLGFQIIAVLIVVVTITMVSFGYKSINDQRKMLEKKLAAISVNTVQWLGAALAQPIYNFDTVTVDSLCRALLLQNYIALIRVNANDDINVYAADNVDPANMVSEKYISTAASIRYMETQIGGVEIYVSKEDLQKQIRKLTYISHQSRFLRLT